MDEAHKARYSIHPAAKKDVLRLKESLLVVEHEDRNCYVCEQVSDLL